MIKPRSEFKSRMFRVLGWLGALPLLALSLGSPVFAAAGTEGASFLDIPVGARPAALGSAYSAVAGDVYAPTWNPGGLGQIETNELAGQHLSYLESIYYEYVSFVHPLGKNRGLGASLQYLGSGNIPGTDINGNPTGDFTSHYAAYNLAYGQQLNNRLSLGLNTKIINAKIADVSANAYAVDMGSLYQATSRLSLAMVLTNVGTKLKFIDQADSLPLAWHFGAAYKTPFKTDLMTEVVYRQNGLASFHVGGEWTPTPPLSLRIGYRTDTVKGLSPMAGLTLGIGIRAWGHEFAYAWLPVGDLGNTQYFSLIMRFGGTKPPRRNLIQYQAIKTPKSETGEDPKAYLELMEILDDEKTPVAQNPEKEGHRARSD
jgi:hypothetical protein